MSSSSSPSPPSNSESKPIQDEIFFEFLSEMKPSSIKVLGGNIEIIPGLNIYDKSGIENNEVLSNQVHEILPHLFLGNVEVSQNKEFLLDNGIKGIVNMALHLENRFEDSKIEFKFGPLDYLKGVQVYDATCADIITSLPKIIDFIDMHLKKQQGVLVHCFAGISRSVSAVCAYLMYKKNLNFAQALDFIRERRSIPPPDPNEGFRYQLNLSSTEKMLKSLQEQSKNT